MSTIPATAVAQDGSRDGGDEPTPVPIWLSLNSGRFGDLTPLPVTSENVEQHTMLGSPKPPSPLPGYIVGTWATNDVTIPLSIYGSFTATMWAESQQGAKNAYFEIEVYKDGTFIDRFNTTKQEVHGTPTRFDISDDLNVEMATNEQLSVTVYFYSDMVVNPGWPFPQPSNVNFLFGGGQYDSGISVTTVPFYIDVIEPEVDKGVDYIGFRGLVQEAFDTDPAKLNYSITIAPPPGGQVDTLTNAEAKKEETGIVVSVDWLYTKDKEVKDGQYTVTIEVSYDGALFFSNTSKFDLKVPRKSVTNLEETPLEPIIIVCAVCGIVIVGLAVYLNLKKRRLARGKGKGKAKPKGKAKGKAKATKPPKKKAAPKEDEEEEDDDEEDD